MAGAAYCTDCGSSNPGNMTSCTTCGCKLNSVPRKNPINSHTLRAKPMAVFDIDMTLLNNEQRYTDAKRAGVIDKDGKAKRKTRFETPGKAFQRAQNFLFDASRLEKDRLIPGAADFVNQLVEDGYIVAYCTGRRLTYYEVTRAQLEKKGFPIMKDDQDRELLFMRTGGSKTTPEYKKGVLSALNAAYDVRFFFDDLVENLQAAAQVGVPGLYPSIKAYTDLSAKSNPYRETSEDDFFPGNTEVAPTYMTAQTIPITALQNPPVKPRRKKMKNGKYCKEPAKNYIDRFMGNSKMNGEFPDRGQRYAVALSYVEKYYGKSGLDSVGARRNPEEYQEDYMVPRDIHRLGKAADRLEDTYEDGQEVPEWWKSKLSVAAKDTDTLADSLEYVDERGNPMPLMGLSVQVSGYRNAAGAFVMKGKKFLILQRSKKETSKHGLWELPGGKVEEGETPRQAAVIEAKEEAGLDIKLKTNLGPHHDNKKKKTYHAYIATPKKGQKVKLSEEHSAHKWVTPEEVLAMPKKMVSHHLLYFLKKEGETIRNNPRKNPPWFYKIEDAKEEAQRLANETGRVHYVIMNAYMMEDGGREIEFEVRDEPLVGDDSPTDYGEQLAEIHPETRDNPGNSKKIEKGKKLYKHMNGKEPEKIEKKKIDMGDVWYQVGEGGCWQIGYMSGKETGNSEQKYTHTFNEETKDGNFPKLYATMPENGKPLLIIQGGTWKIKTDDQGVAWIYD